MSHPRGFDLDVVEPDGEAGRRRKVEMVLDLKVEVWLRGVARVTTPADLLAALDALAGVDRHAARDHP